MMNALILVLECVAIAVALTLNVVHWIGKDPTLAVADYPPEIQEAYYKSQGKEPEREKLTARGYVIKALMLCLYFAAMAALALLAGARSFWQGFWAAAAYGFTMFAADTFFVDWVLLPRVKKWRLPGTEHMDREYAQKWFHVKACLPMVPVFAAAAVLIGLVVMWLG